MHITKHSEERCKDRLGLSKKITGKVAEKAIKEGKGLNDLKGSLKRYIGYIYLKNDRKFTHIRVYNQKIFLFTETYILVTILELPSKYKKCS